LAIGLGLSLVLVIRRAEWRRSALLIGAVLLAGGSAALAGGWSGFVYLKATSQVAELPARVASYGSLLIALAAAGTALLVASPSRLSAAVGSLAGIRVRHIEPAATGRRLAARARSLVGINTALVLVIVAIAAVVRFWNFNALGYSHWDEDYFVGSGQRLQHASPLDLQVVDWWIMPLVPITDSLFFRLLGYHTWVPLAISAGYGTLAVGAVYLLGSRIYSTTIGLWAALVMGVSEFAVMYSRLALADATFNFYLILSALFLWLGFTRRRLAWYALAGVSTGLLMNTKYSGSFPLFLAVTWLALELLWDLARTRRGEWRQRFTEYGPRFLGTAVMIGVAALLFLPYLRTLETSPGIPQVLATFGRFSAQSPSMHTPPSTVLHYFWLLTSPATVAFALAGVAACVLRPGRAGRFLLLFTGAWFVALTRFGPYPREALSLLPPVCILAALGLDMVRRRLDDMPSRLRLPGLGLAASLVGLTAILISQLVALPGLVAMRTTGYAEAAEAAHRVQRDGTVFTHLQANSLLYDTGGVALVVSADNATLLRQPGTKYFIVDQTRFWAPAMSEFFSQNASSLQVYEEISNPLYPEVILQPAYEYRFPSARNPPHEYRFITIYRATGPLTIPASWSAS
jgi:4-amino-4-deoxy-L-arabinose transferase-like glycosyltransferase